tara:strand:- start:170 stop:667 length:498 start_codon:yes stop_codon:yes gene_type:complete
MELDNQPSFDSPIPGQSLTAELGGRPWQSKQQFSTVDETIDYYMERMSSEDFMVQLVEVLESGVPVTVLANTIQMAGVMDGKHSLDVGMLVLPMLMEMMMMLGDSAGIKYDKGLNDPNKPLLRDSAIAKAVAEYENKIEDKDTTTKEKEVIEEEDEPSGLMARRK